MLGCDHLYLELVENSCKQLVCLIFSYCASRILKFDKNGKLIGQFGLEDAQIPHSLALAEDLDLICVADREGMR